MKNILIIDDKNENLITSEAILKDNINKCNIFKALSGKEGIKIAIKEQPDVILLDIVMPEMDGYQTCKKLKKDKRTNHIPIILIMAVKIDTQSRIKGLNSGADAFLSKPIDTNEFIAQVNSILRIKEAEDKLRNESEKLRKTLEDQHIKLESETESRISTDFLLEQRYNKIFQFSPDSILIHDLDMNILDANNKAIKEFGYSKDELLKMKVFDLHTETELNHSAQVLAEMKKKEWLTVETKFVRKNGSVFSAEITPCKYNLGNKQIIHVVIRDITDRKKTKNNLRLSDEKFRRYVEQASEGIYLFQLKEPISVDMPVEEQIKNLYEGYIIEANDSLAKMYGFDKANELNGMTLAEFHGGTDNPENIEFLRSWIEANYRITDAESKEVDKDGNELWITNNIIGHLEDGYLIHIWGTQTDITEKKQAENTLRDTNARHSAMIENIGDVIAIVGEDGKTKYQSPNIEKWFGWKPEELIGTSGWDKIHPEDIERIQKEFSKVLEKETASLVEYRFKCKDGNYKWIELTAVNRINDPAINGILLNYHDITERKKVEEEKAKIYNSIQTAIYVYDFVKSENDYINPEYTKLLGWTLDDINKMGNKFTELFHPDDFKQVVKHMQIVSETTEDNTHILEYRFKHKNGQWRWCLSYDTPLQRMVNGDVEKMIGSFIDITERKRAEQIQKVLYNISNAVIISDNLENLIILIQKELGTIIHTSNFYIALYDNITDTLSLPFFTDEKDKFNSFPAGKTLTNYVIKTQKSLLATKNDIEILEQSGDIETIGADSEIWLGVPLKIEGEVTGVLAVQSYTDKNAFTESDKEILEFVSDQISISIERKKNEDELIEALKKATESDRLKSAFLTNMSHEIRTPMNGILGFTELLKEPELTGDNQQDYIEIIEKSGVRMLNTIKNLMDISMIESEQVKTSLSTTNINELINNLYSFFKLESDHKSLELLTNYSLKDKDALIKTDVDKVNSILTNIIKNAIKFTHKGSIEIGCKLKGESEQRVIEFYVKDTGIGIPKDRQAAIFERFVKADIEDRAVYEGNGIGLSISKAFVEILGGEIWVNSEVGDLPAGKVGGSEFYFTIPYISDIGEAETDIEASSHIEKDI